MKIFNKVTFLAIALLVACVSLNAQEKKIAPAQNRTAKPLTKRPSFDARDKFPKPVQYLMRFSGKWAATAAFVSNGKTDSVQYNLIGRSVAEGYGLLLEESFNDSAFGKLRGTNLAGYDSSDGKIHWYSVDNQGPAHDHTGEWLSPDSLVLNHTSVDKGKNYREKINFAFKGRDEFHFVFVSSVDGKEQKRATAVFRRVMPVKKPNAAPEKKD